jgi:5-methylcytosine-specific restriction endonuclease McrA
VTADCLLLNFSYEPLGVVNIARAVKLLVNGKAEIARDPETGELHVAPDRELRSAGTAFPLPTVLRMLYYVARRKKQVPLTKKNLLLRDDYTCGYCGARGDSKMTVDHIVPSSRGGPSDWLNLVACCMPCNQRKRDRLPEEARMPLLRKPYVPRFIPWVVIRRNTLPGEWGKYLVLYSVSIDERRSE